MADERDTGASYSERELALILKRASELQGKEVESRMRYSLSDIQDIALGAGIDADSVAVAAAELRTPTQTGPWLIAGPTRFRAERTVPVVLAPTAFAEVVEAIRKETGLQGKAEQVFDTLEWRGRETSGEVFVTVAPRDQHTRVTVTAARADEAVLAGMVGTGAAAVAAAASVALLHAAGLPGAAIGALTVVASAGTMVGVTRLMWRRKMEKWRRRAPEIAQSIAARLKQVSGS
jgi:hypothetical protein